MSGAGYYQWRGRTQPASAAWQVAAQAAFPRHARRYGTRRLRAELRAEAGWSTLKTELLPGASPFASLEKARLEVAWYLDTYFNLDRRHSALGYRAPHQFEHELRTNLP